MDRSSLPVVVIGAGPVGLAAAAHLLERGIEPLILERGARVGSSMREWGHVRLFSPWRYVVDRAAGDLLRQDGWQDPDPEAYPTGGDIVGRYLEPLAAQPALRDCIRLNSEVVSVTRDRFDKMKTPGRDEAPFLVTVRTPDGAEEDILARAVIDSSGTWMTPNPLGASGRPASGERALADHIAYGIPDVLGAARERYAGKRVLVVGSGHSAFNALLDLVRLADEAPGTEITWAIRKPANRLQNLFGGGENDALPARGELGARVHALVGAGRLRLETGVHITKLALTDDGIVAWSGDRALAPVDEIIGATGFRPDLEPLSELRLGLDPAVDSPTALAPLIDPNVHSCGSVPPHGAMELQHPETDFYIVGMKSYGRAPTFLMLTGYEQVRSIAAALAGDWAAARDVQLVLPETGVCSTNIPGLENIACCGVDESATVVSSCCGVDEPQVIKLTTLKREPVAHD
jgi:hypothetical protein